MRTRIFSKSIMIFAILVCFICQARAISSERDEFVMPKGLRLDRPFRWYYQLRLVNRELIDNNFNLQDQAKKYLKELKKHIRKKRVKKIHVELEVITKEEFNPRVPTFVKNSKIKVVWFDKDAMTPQIYEIQLKALALIIDFHETGHLLLGHAQVEGIPQLVIEYALFKGIVEKTQNFLSSLSGEAKSLPLVLALDAYTEAGKIYTYAHENPFIEHPEDFPEYRHSPVDLVKFVAETYEFTPHPDKFSNLLDSLEKITYKGEMVTGVLGKEFELSRKDINDIMSGVEELWWGSLNYLGESNKKKQSSDLPLNTRLKNKTHSTTKMSRKLIFGNNPHLEYEGNGIRREEWPDGRVIIHITDDVSGLTFTIGAEGHEYLSQADSPTMELQQRLGLANIINVSGSAVDLSDAIDRREDPVVDKMLEKAITSGVHAFVKTYRISKLRIIDSQIQFTIIGKDKKGKIVYWANEKGDSPREAPLVSYYTEGFKRENPVVVIDNGVVIGEAPAKFDCSRPPLLLEANFWYIVNDYQEFVGRDNRNNRLCRKAIEAVRDLADDIVCHRRKCAHKQVKEVYRHVWCTHSSSEYYVGCQVQVWVVCQPAGGR